MSAAVPHAVPRRASVLELRKWRIMRTLCSSSHVCLPAAQSSGVDYGALFRGTETLFRFYSPKQVVSAGRFKEGG